MSLTKWSFALALALLAVCGQAQDWELKKEKDGIKVFTKSSEGNFLVYRAKTVFDAKLEEVVGALVDIPSFAKWMPDTKEAKVLENRSDSQMVYYLSTKAPWPVSDRDGIYSYHISYDKGTQTVTVQFDALPDFMPEDEDHVRIQESTGYWKLTRLKDERVALDYQVRAEPGGSVPAWLARTKVVSIPFETVSSLRDRVDEGHYADETFSFIGN